MWEIIAYGGQQGCMVDFADAAAWARLLWANEPRAGKPHIRRVRA